MTKYARTLTYEQADEIITAMINVKLIAGPGGYDIMSQSDAHFFNAIIDRVATKITKACPEWLYNRKGSN